MAEATGLLEENISLVIDDENIINEKNTGLENYQGMENNNIRKE